MHGEEDYYKPVRVGTFWSNNYIEYERSSIEIKNYQFKNISIKPDHTQQTSNLIRGKFNYQ